MLCTWHLSAETAPSGRNTCSLIHRFCEERKERGKGLVGINRRNERGRLKIRKEGIISEEVIDLKGIYLNTFSELMRMVQRDEDIQGTNKRETWTKDEAMETVIHF
jgi:hypothetical protein